jgi:SAM-dependent methyltransferase
MDFRYEEECVRKSEFGKHFLDPCNPVGSKVIRTNFIDRRGTMRMSPGLGHLERHRINCLILPHVFHQILEARAGRRTLDVSQTVDYKKSAALVPVRILAFGPQHEESNLKIILDSSSQHAVHVDYIAADYSKALIDQVTDRAGFAIDAMHIPFPDNFFTAVLFVHVLEHVPNLSTTLDEIYRVLASDGFAVLTAPFRGGQHTFENFSCSTTECRSKAFGQFDHVRNIGTDIFQLMGHYTVYTGIAGDFIRSQYPQFNKVFRNKEFSSTYERFIYAFKLPPSSRIQSVFGLSKHRTSS